MKKVYPCASAQGIVFAESVDKFKHLRYNNGTRNFWRSFNMRKMKTAIVSMLAALMALFCLVGCGTTGKYIATAYKAGPITMDLTDSDSYVELKGGDEAVVSIDLVVGKLEGTGTWTKGEEKNTVVVTVEGIEYTATIEDGKMTMNIFGTSLIFTKE